MSAVFLCTLMAGCEVPKEQEELTIKEVDMKIEVFMNQLGFSSSSPKTAVIRVDGVSSSELDSDTFAYEIVKNGVSIIKGKLIASKEFSEWNTLGGAEKMSPKTYAYWTADFSVIDSPGKYAFVAHLGKQSSAALEFEVASKIELEKTANAVLNYFTLNRHLEESDKSIRIFDSERRVNVWGGWMDAGGDTGKYLSHLSYANFMNPQQAALVTWALSKAHLKLSAEFKSLDLEGKVIDEALWGADYLHRILDAEGYFYLTIFDGWGSAPERMVTGYVGKEGKFTDGYKAAFREGGGVAIAALASAYQLAKSTGEKGEFSAEQYLAAAEKGFEHLQKNNRAYCDNGKENIIDDYTALIAASELFKATGKSAYLTVARERAANLVKRVSVDGWFISDGDIGAGEALGQRPYFHGAEEGLPLIALVDYMKLETDLGLVSSTKAAISKVLSYHLKVTAEVSNPYNYARQTFRTFKDGQYGDVKTGFFIPHANETNYWWQGESARLASLTAASIWSARLLDGYQGVSFGVRTDVATYAQNQLDWILGKNPYGMCHLYGFGHKNPPHAESAGSMVIGGISNGITGATESDEGRGITWAEGPDANNWRWIEQWIPHSTWFLLAMTAMHDAEGSVK